MVLVVALPILAVSTRPATAQDRWFSADKLLHFIGALAVTTLSYSLAYDGFGWDRDESRTFAIATATSLSVGKEIYDIFTTGQPSAKDLFWDGLGIGVGLLLIEQRGGRTVAGGGGGVFHSPGLSAIWPHTRFRAAGRPADVWVPGWPGLSSGGPRLNPIDTPSDPFSLRILQMRSPGD